MDTAFTEFENRGEIGMGRNMYKKVYNNTYLLADACTCIIEKPPQIHTSKYLLTMLKSFGNIAVTPGRLEVTSG